MLFSYSFFLIICLVTFPAVSRQDLVCVHYDFFFSVMMFCDHTLRSLVIDGVQNVFFFVFVFVAVFICFIVQLGHDGVCSFIAILSMVSFVCEL